MKKINKSYTEASKRFLKNRAIKITAPILVAIAFSMGMVGSVFAIDYGGIGGRPAYPQQDNPRTQSIFIHTLELGAVQDEGVNIVNNTAEQKTVLVYAADSTPSTGGAFACKQMTESKNDVGAWISLEKTEVVLESGTSEIVPFTITVPENASVGEHNGCILLQEKKDKVAGQAGASISVRTGLRVAITIPGDIVRKLEIIGFTVTPTPGAFVLHPLVKNTGNVSIDTNVQVETRNFLGMKVFTHGGQYPVLRGDTSDWNFELKDPFWGGWYSSHFSISYDANLTSEVGKQSGGKLEELSGPTVWFFSFPTRPALIIEIIIVLVILACLFLFWLSRKRKKWIKNNWVPYEVQIGDDIQLIAKKFLVSWKIIAKVNVLKPPYALTPGQNIKVPPRT